MLFSSIPFLYYFLPLALIFYFLAPAKFKNTVLLAFSLIFYGWGEPKYLFLMIVSIGAFAGTIPAKACRQMDLLLFCSSQSWISSLFQIC